MGNVSSKCDESSPLVLREQNRLAITSVKITNSRNRPLYTITPNAFPASRFTVKRELDEDTPVEYVQDPEQNSVSAPTFLLRLNNDEDIIFYFTFIMRQGQAPSSTSSNEFVTYDTVINSLTFLFASTWRELDTLVTREFNADPNLHKNPNVDLVGDYSTAGSGVEQFEWSWKWRPPKMERDKGGGWRTSCSFVEYDQRAHKLNTLVNFSFWVNQSRPFSSPKFKSRLLEPQMGPRFRVPSSQSVDSRLSDSETEGTNYRDPASPNLERTILEEGMGPEQIPNSNAIKVDLNFQKPGEDVSAVEDGPVFRATIKALEQRTGNMRSRMKAVLKKAEAAKESQVMSNRAIAAFMEALRDASSSNANAVQPALDHYFEKIATEILAYEKRNAEILQRLIIDPLSKIYSNDIKQVDSKKKDFEDESKEYYGYVGKYLGQRQDSLKEKKRVESDSKYQVKRKNFELKRFDYSSFMQDLHGGRKDQEVLSQLTKYADAQATGYLSTAKNIETMMPQLEALVAEVREADKEYQLIRTGREEKRRTLEKGSKPSHDSDTIGGSVGSSAASMASGPRGFSDGELGQANGQASMSVAEKRLSGVPIGSSLVPQVTSESALAVSPRSGTSATSSPAANKYKGYRDLEERDSTATSDVTQQKREGLLWSLSKSGGSHYVDPKNLNKQAWHKYWIVLDGGKLAEYVNWKDQLEQHRDPIDLRVASVREARNAERRFCFEVITPSFTRVYQAPSENDMKSWIASINNALQGAFESSKGIPIPLQSSASTSHRSGSSMARDLFGKSSSFHGHRSSSISTQQQAAKNSIPRHATVGESRGHLLRSQSDEERPTHLVQLVRDADAGNALCADCGSDSRVEWVSINLGIIVCIECSGIHRSLGTHITKMRSLTLDTQAFTVDVIEILLRIGNRVSNMIYEARLDQSSNLKPTPKSSRDDRLRFITAKYSAHAYVAPHPTPPSDLLLSSIKTQNLQNIIHALALSANPNATDRSRATHAIFLALAAADPAAPGTPNQIPHVAGANLATTDRKPFAIAELLVQNGAEIPMMNPPIPLGRSAWLYLEFKKEQKLGRHGDGRGDRKTDPSPPPSAARNQTLTSAGSLAPSAGAARSDDIFRAQGKPGSEDTLTALPRIDARRTLGRTSSGGIA